MKRREFLDAGVAAAAGALLLSGGRAAAGAAAGNHPPPQTGLPKGKIGKLEVSRLLLGGNLLSHYTHSRELRYVYNLAAHYNTEKKIFETLAIAEQQGINTLAITASVGITGMLKRYREKHGGKIQWIMCHGTPIEPGLAKYEEQVQKTIDDGADAIYIFGGHGDALAIAGKIDLLGKAVDLVKTHGVPCGVGAHLLRVIQECERNKIDNDFYVKTFHHHRYNSAATVSMLANRGPDVKEETLDLAPKFPGQLAVDSANHDAMWCFTPKETAEVMKGVAKPWIAFKVMAAGAIPPQDAFRYAFGNGADFVLAGMFDFEVAEDVRIATETLAGLPQRARPWRA